MIKLKNCLHCVVKMNHDVHNVLLLHTLLIIVNGI